MFNRRKNSDPSVTLRSFRSLASAFGFGQLTADKRFGSCRASPKLLSATSFIRRTLFEIPNRAFKRKNYIVKGQIN